MGTKVDGFIAKVGKLRSDDPLSPMGDAAEVLLDADARPDGMMAMADQVASLKAVKSFVASLAEAVNEQLEDRLKELYDSMLDDEMQMFNRKGQTYYLTTQRYVQAKKELGGTSNPGLITFLESNGMGEIAKKNVNANSLRSAINSFLEDNPVEKVVDGELIDASNPEIYEALGIEDTTREVEVETDEGIVRKQEPWPAQDQLQARLDARYEIEQLVNLTENPTVGVRKAAK